MRTSFLIAAAIAGTTFISATPASAAWHVDNAQSTFTFVTAKAGMPGSSEVEEVQAFRQIGGTVSDDGRLQFNVDLASVETNVGLRNERLKDLLFKVAQHPQATFSASVDTRRFDALPAGGTADVQLNGTLTIAGQSNPLVADLRIVKLSRNALLVGTRVPIIVSLKEYGLQDGVDALRNVMNLNVLSGSAPVTFSVVLRADR
jgi:polyisoprenoid-binding protein YceI